MAAAASILLTDGKTTPVVHTFAPAKTSADYSMFEDRSGGIYIGYNKLHLTLIRPKGDSKVSNRNLKVAIALEAPTLEVLGNAANGLTPPPTLAYRLLGKLEFTFADRSSPAERKDVRVMMRDAMNNPAVVELIEQFSPPW